MLYNSRNISSQASKYVTMYIHFRTNNAQYGATKFLVSSFYLAKPGLVGVYGSSHGTILNKIYFNLEMDRGGWYTIGYVSTRILYRPQGFWFFVGVYGVRRRIW